MQSDTPIGIIGLGLMGTALSERLIDANIPVIGFDIDPVRCGMLLARDFRPQSYISQTLKDAEPILGEAARRGLDLPVTTAQAELLRAAIALAGPDSDSAAIIEAVRRRPARSELPR